MSQFADRQAGFGSVAVTVGESGRALSSMAAADTDDRGGRGSTFERCAAASETVAPFCGSMRERVRRFFNDNSHHMVRAINDAVKRGAHLGLRGARM